MPEILSLPSVAELGAMSNLLGVSSGQLSSLVSSAVAASDHNHENYALSDHNHGNYALSGHGHNWDKISNDVRIVCKWHYVSSPPVYPVSLVLDSSILPITVDVFSCCGLAVRPLTSDTAYLSPDGTVVSSWAGFKGSAWSLERGVNNWSLDSSVASAGLFDMPVCFILFCSFMCEF